jgi:predicted nucleic acid-binding protein
VDTNILLDSATSDPVFAAASNDCIRVLRHASELCINAIIYGELAPAFEDQATLDRFLDRAIYTRLLIPCEAGWSAAKAFERYRSAGGSKTVLLPDFIIGAHAEVEGLSILTRDTSRYRTYFPTVPLFTPSRE